MPWQRWLVEVPAAIVTVWMAVYRWVIIVGGIIGVTAGLLALGQLAWVAWLTH